MNTKSSLVRELKDKEYRDSYVASQIRIGLPMQCRALRESREWTQPRLAQLSGMSQPRISEIERPGERRLNIETLLRLASAFDVALQVRFVPFSRLVDDDEDIDLNRFYVKPFDEDLASIERIEEQRGLGGCRARSGSAGEEEAVMSDIKQAAEWMREGKKVRRKGWHPDAFLYDQVLDGDSYPAGAIIAVWTQDLLADDWEVVQ